MTLEMRNSSQRTNRIIAKWGKLTEILIPPVNGNGDCNIHHCTWIWTLVQPHGRKQVVWKSPHASAREEVANCLGDTCVPCVVLLVTEFGEMVDRRLGSPLGGVVMENSPLKESLKMFWWNPRFTNISDEGNPRVNIFMIYYNFYGFGTMWIRRTVAFMVLYI